MTAWAAANCAETVPRPAFVRRLEGLSVRGPSYARPGGRPVLLAAEDGDDPLAHQHDQRQRVRHADPLVSFLAGAIADTPARYSAIRRDSRASIRRLFIGDLMYSFKWASTFACAFDQAGIAS